VFSNLSARLRIVLVVLASTLPVLALTVFVGFSQRSTAEALERQELQLIAELTAKRPEQIIESARQLLFAVAGNVDYLLRDSASCEAYFRRLQPEGGSIYRSMGLILPDGTVFCNSASAPGAGTVSVADRYYFRTAVRSGAFTVGDFRVSRSTGEPGMNFAYPVFAPGGRLQAVVFAGLNLDTFVEAGQQGLGRVVTLFDRGGIVIAQYPTFRASIGKPSPNPEVAARIAETGSGLFSAVDLTGVTRLYAVRGIGMNPDGAIPIRVVVSTPENMIFAESNRALVQTIAGTVLVLLVLMAIAWIGAEVVVVRRFRVLLDMAERVRAGDLGARSGFENGREELTRLGIAMDAMAQELQARDAELKRVMQQLNELAVTDQLTGLPNRRYLWDRLGAELMRARRKGAPLSVLLFDIDYFKAFNDRWGHEAGDLVLRNVAHAIRRVVRGSDIVARHGGEEFVIVLPEAGEDIALTRAEELRREISALRLTFGGEALDTITVSVGVVCSRDAGDSAEDLVRAADHAMYEAKQGGRDRVVLAAAP
jgi:diguanylate cyclase (GGDEF)-like protein